MESGLVFGSLTTIGNEGALVLCLCECGNKTLVNPYYLANGTITECDTTNYNYLDYKYIEN